MTDTEETRFGTALREHADRTTIDLDRLATGAVRTGTRIRRRRRAGIGIAGLAAAAVITTPLAISQWGGDSGVDDTSDGVDVASGTSPAPNAELNEEEQVVALLDRIGIVAAVDRVNRVVAPSSSSISVDQRRELEEGLPPGWRVELRDPVSREQVVDEVPVEIPEGWTCEWFLADDKGTCESDTGLLTAVVFRPESDYAKYEGGYDDYAVSELHHGYFMTIQPVPPMTKADAHDLAEAMEWVKAPH